MMARDRGIEVTQQQLVPLGQEFWPNPPRDEAAHLNVGPNDLSDLMGRMGLPSTEYEDWQGTAAEFEQLLRGGSAIAQVLQYTEPVNMARATVVLVDGVHWLHSGDGDPRLYGDQTTPRWPGDHTNGRPLVLTRSPTSGQSYAVDWDEYEQAFLYRDKDLVSSVHNLFVPPPELFDRLRSTPSTSAGQDAAFTLLPGPVEGTDIERGPDLSEPKQDDRLVPGPTALSPGVRRPFEPGLRGFQPDLRDGLFATPTELPPGFAAPVVQPGPNLDEAWDPGANYLAVTGEPWGPEDSGPGAAAAAGPSIEGWLPLEVDLSTAQRPALTFGVGALLLAGGLWLHGTGGGCMVQVFCPEYVAE